ncbi:hypothetical protein QN386_06905 [Pseudomonas sp. CCI3.2]|uniref:hypothetical protein n=1 Tax=unclassified Pseudomonas TaxID=196821 RepID=UPI002B22631E|nr:MULTISPECIES: hypothetical protein [unclassified Pseudomonas]MEB0076306.1 hypothetical protein [Pseudomonas sp. MH10out]MEB0101055.1 hypothetical protein [Pseudomonas sp. CCI3.2]MEB0128914.1 hypothetical protein [Pseudomonas sp. CCI2.4]
MEAEMILDCSDQNTAWSTVCKILNTDKSTLTLLLKPLNPYQYHTYKPEEYIYKEICDALGSSRSEIKAMWFHGTRTNDIASFHTRGILPKSAVKKEIESALISLSSGIERKGNNQFSMSIQGKQTPADEGPFAVLFKEVAIHAPGFNHSYIDVPEMIEEVAGTLLGENYDKLVMRYRSITKPYVVTFVGEAGQHELSLALWYLHSIVDGDPPVEAADRANTCFNSNGITIDPLRIVRVELIDNV